LREAAVCILIFVYKELAYFIGTRKFVTFVWMKCKTFILLFVIVFVSCKKDAKTNTTTPPVPVIRTFYFKASDGNGNALTNITGNTFIINFYQNNTIVYTVKTKTAGANAGFNISNFVDGGYIFEVSDSLNLFGYNKDSIYIKNNTYYLGSINSVGTSIVNGNLGSIQQKPTYTISSYSVVKDTSVGGGSGVYIKVNVSGLVNEGYITIFFYKNNMVSCNNLYNYSSLWGSHSVSNSNPSMSLIIDDGTLEESPIPLQSGDSCYFAVYTGITDGGAYDRYAPKDIMGHFQYTTFGSQRIVIPYKIH